MSYQDNADPRVAFNPGHSDSLTKGPGPWDHLIHKDIQSPARGGPPFSTRNQDALGVYQRASSDWNASTIYLGANNINDPVKIVDRQAGRDWVLLVVPTTAPAGIFIASTDSQLQSVVDTPTGSPNLGGLITVGGSISLPTEAAIWAVSAIVGTVTFVCVYVGLNTARTF